MKNIVIILITLLTFSTDVLSQSVKPFKTRDGSINMKDGLVFSNHSSKTYSLNKKVNIKKCDTTKYIYNGKNQKTLTYFVDFKLKEIVILTNRNKTYVDKYDIIKYKASTKPKPITQGYYLKFYIVCKSENNIIKFFKDGSGLTITIYDKKTKNSTISVVTLYTHCAKGDYYE